MNANQYNKLTDYIHNIEVDLSNDNIYGGNDWYQSDCAYYDMDDDYEIIKRYGKFLR